jgi:hypothetical protein
MEYYSQVTVHEVLGDGSRQICGTAPAVQISVVGSAHLACSSSGGSFLGTGLLWRSDLRVGGQLCCSATGLGSGCPKIDERQGRSGREGNFGNDCWANRWGLRQW